MTHTDQPVHPNHALPYTPGPQKGSNGLATAGFVLGLLGLLSSWIPFLNVIGIVLGVIGVVLAGVGLAKSKKVNAGKGLSIAGLILGGLAIVFAIAINALFVSAVDTAIEETTKTSVDAPSGEGETKPAGDKGGSKADLGTTRDNPAPLGSTITGDDWKVKINSVRTVAQDSIGQAPEKGSVLISINMTATYTGNDEQGSTPWATVNFVGADGTTVDSTSGSTMFIAENEFDSLTTVYNGASVKGDQLLEVPAGAWENGVLAVSPGMLSDDTFVAVK